MPVLSVSLLWKPGRRILCPLLLCWYVAGGVPVGSQGFELVADYASGSTQTGLFIDGLVYSQGVVVNGYTLFSGCTEAFGCELWRSDGTALGTEMLVDTDPGPRHGLLYGNLTLFEGAAYFTAGFPAQLWRSDGTPEGTEVIVERVAGFGGDDVRVANGALWFEGYDADHGDEPWTSDGTTAGSYRVADIAPGIEDSNPLGFVAAGGLVYFRATSPLHGSELWASDGSEAGTYLVADVRPGSEGSSPNALLPFGTDIFFVANDGTNGSELWRSDGSGLGTVRLEIRTGPEGSSVAPIGELPGGVLLLVADDGVDGRELWRTNGTIVQQVVDLYPGATSGVPLGGDWLVVGDFVYFSGFADNGTGEELWRTDGTAAGTQQVADIEAGALSSGPRNFVPLGDSLYYTADDLASGRELWVTDLISGATSQVTDLDGGALSSLEDQMTGFPGPNGELLFAGEVEPLGFELWRTDGTAGGTQRLTDIIDPASSEPRNLTPWILGDFLFQPAEGDDVGALVKVDDSDYDTTTYPFPFPEHPIASALRVWENTLFLAERSPASSHTRLWTWNGFSETLVAEDTTAAVTFGLNPTPNGLAFIKSGELSLTDGTVVGDFSLLELASPPVGAITRLWYSEDAIWYTVGEQLWRTDLVNDTSELLVDLSSDPELDFLELHGEVGGTFYFDMRRTVGGVFEETLVCAVDATPSGYSEVLSFDAAAGFVTSDLFDLGSDAVLLSDVDPDTWELHRLEGAASPSVFVSEGSGRPFDARAASSHMAFRTDAGVWRSDGTVAGTTLVPGTQDFEINTTRPGWALVSGPQVGRGFELALVALDTGTFVELPEIQPGPAGTVIEELLIDDEDVLWVSAFRLDVGTELFRLDLTPFLIDPATILFTDGFESGDTSPWSATIP